jgi:hypothetical protein
MTRNDLENNRFKIIGTIGLGALLMYVFDPQQDRRRRARLRDKMIHYNARRGRGLMRPRAISKTERRVLPSRLARCFREKMQAALNWCSGYAQPCAAS